MTDRRDRDIIDIRLPERPKPPPDEEYHFEVGWLFILELWPAILGILLGLAVVAVLL